MKGEKHFRGFSVDTFTEKRVKDALVFHISGEVTYTPYATKDGWVLCKVNI